MAGDAASGAKDAPLEKTLVEGGCGALPASVPQHDAGSGGLGAQCSQSSAAAPASRGAGSRSRPDLTSQLTAAPEAKAVTTAAMGRRMVITGPSRLHDAATESTPVSGVEMVNALVAPLLAPPFRKDKATGTTEQLHNGRGAPTAAAHATDLRSSPPILRANHAVERWRLTTPASRKPTSSNGAICRYKDHDESSTARACGRIAS